MCSYLQPIDSLNHIAKKNESIILLPEMIYMFAKRPVQKVFKRTLLMVTLD